MKKKNKIEEFRKQSVPALEEQITSLEEEFLRLRFRHASGQLEQTAQLQALRRQIAQGKTILSESLRKDRSASDASGKAV